MPSSQYEIMLDTKTKLAAQVKRLPNIIAPVGDPVTVHRIEIKCDPINIAQWLHAQTQDTKLYWANRAGELEIGCVGVCDEINGRDRVDVKDVLDHMNQRFNPLIPQLRYFGGMCFDYDNMDESWQDFGTYHFFIPRFEYVQNNGEYTFACNIRYNEISEEQLNEIINQHEQLIFDLPESTDIKIKPQAREDFPNQDQWSDIFAKTLKAFNTDSLKKVVLARKSSFQTLDDLSPFLMKERLKQMTPECYHFCFQPKPDIAFLGASPERLYKRIKQNIKSEAIAGTRRKGITDEEDTRFRNELMESAKERSEHKIVVDDICEELNEFCDNVKSDSEPNIFEMKWGHHLKTQIEGTLKSGIADDQIIDALHPTPAVAGNPTEKAVKFINEHEPFKRGWYSGPFGFISRDHVEFTVAIRSGLINKNKISLFAGAGILPESKKTEEWQEIENKMGGFFRAFEI